MATDKLFTVCGTSNLNGEFKVRFANDTLRTKVLQKSKHTDINLIELDEAMSKLDAVKFIQGLDEFANAGSQSAIADYLERNEPTAKAPKAVAKAAPKAKAKVAAPKAKATAKTKAEDEDTPFKAAEAAVGEALV